MPRATSARPRGPSTPLPVTERNSSAGESEAALLGPGDDGRRERVLAAALEAGREPQHLGLVERPPAAVTDVSRGLPSVRVPVLSTTSVSTFSSVSSASAFLIRTPAVAPRPMPTMIDIGVASPSAQGQAMMSTATALTRA